MGAQRLGPVCFALVGMRVRVCACVRPSQLPGGPPEASPGLEARQDLRPKGLGGNGGVPDLRLPSLPKKSPTDFEI